MVNGTVYPFLNVEPKAYRFRILNACNDRFLNLQLYLDASGGGTGATATAIVDCHWIYFGDRDYERRLRLCPASRGQHHRRRRFRRHGFRHDFRWGGYRHHDYQPRQWLYLRSYRHHWRQNGSQYGSGVPEWDAIPPGRRTAGMAACRTRPRRAPILSRSAPKAASCRGWRCAPTSRLTMTMTGAAPPLGMSRT